MPWIIGIDEAGYGPNLGPFVMTAAACRVPEPLAEADLWHILRAAVRRHSDKADARLLVADSKLVYSSGTGLAALETGVLAMLLGEEIGPALSLQRYLDCACPSAHPELRDEHWYTGTTLLPVEAAASVCTASAAEFRQECRKAGVVWEPVRSAVVLPPRFNELVDQWGSKGAVLGHALAELLRDAPNGNEGPAAFFIDKHGGRNFYAAMLQNALPDGTVVAEAEGNARSVYRVMGPAHPVRLTFEPRADMTHFCVALASMASKYLREVFMREFNGFWQTHVPDLAPTAGYPGDATRFFTAIRPAAQRLGIAERALWRCR